MEVSPPRSVAGPFVILIKFEFMEPSHSVSLLLTARPHDLLRGQKQVCAHAK